MRDGLLSVLAGEIFGSSLATRLRVLAFRSVYYTLKTLTRVLPQAIETGA